MKCLVAVLLWFSLLTINDPLSLAQGDPNLIDNDYFDATVEELVKQAKSNIQRAHIEPVAKLIREGNLGYALENVDFALRYFPNHPAALHLLGTVAQLQKRPHLPIPYYERAIKLFPQHALTYAQYGGYLLTIGNSRIGIEKLKQAVEIDPKLALAHVLLAKAYMKIGNAELAREEARLARELGYQGVIE